MTALFTTLKEAIKDGYKISMMSEGGNLIITTENNQHNKREKVYLKEVTTWLPMSDHFTEDRIISAIQFDIERLNKKQ